MAGETVITLVGNLTADPELRFTPSGAAVANFTVASTPRTFDRQSGEWRDGDAMFLNCAIWRQAAENVAESLQKGMRVIVQGRLEADVWEKSDGSTSVRFVVVASAVGHDLGFGTTSFAKDVRRPTSDAEDGRLREVIHSYAEAGPRLDSLVKSTM